MTAGNMFWRNDLDLGNTIYPSPVISDEVIRTDLK
jgi:hypothetical protein